MALSWCKVASNLDSHPKIRKAGRLGREVFLFALRRNAEPGNPVPGRLPKDELAPWYIADQLQMPETEAVTGVTAAVTAGLLAEDGHCYVIVSWKDGWGKDNGTGAERTARWRENKKLHGSDTDHVTGDVTQRHGDSGDTDQKRREEKRSSPAKPTKRSSVLPADWSPRSEERAKAVKTGLNCDAEAEHFRDHHTAKGTLYLDWDAAFRTWLKKAVEFSRGRPPQQSLLDSEPRRIKEIK